MGRKKDHLVPHMQGMTEKVTTRGMYSLRRSEQYERTNTSLCMCVNLAPHSNETSCLRCREERVVQQARALAAVRDYRTDLLRSFAASVGHHRWYPLLALTLTALALPGPGSSCVEPARKIDHQDSASSR